MDAQAPEDDAALMDLVLERIQHDSGHRVKADDVLANPHGPFYCCYCNQPVASATQPLAARCLGRAR